MFSMHQRSRLYSPKKDGLLGCHDKAVQVMRDENYQQAKGHFDELLKAIHPSKLMFSKDIMTLVEEMEKVKFGENYQQFKAKLEKLRNLEVNSVFNSSTLRKIYRDYEECLRELKQDEAAEKFNTSATSLVQQWHRLGEIYVAYGKRLFEVEEFEASSLFFNKAVAFTGSIKFAELAAQADYFSNRGQSRDFNASVNTL